MNTIRLSVSLSLMMAVGIGVARADADSCDDYVARHYRRDLRPTHLAMRDLGGQQEIRLTVRNGGEESVDVGILDVQLGALGISNKPTGPLGSQAERVYTFKVSAGRFSRCQKVRVALDTSRTAGQWGCAVFGNDVLELPVEVDGTISCSAIIRVPVDRPRPHFPPHRFEGRAPASLRTASVSDRIWEFAEDFHGLQPVEPPATPRPDAVLRDDAWPARTHGHEDVARPARGPWRAPAVLGGPRPI
jgi:hypothetical protein